MYGSEERMKTVIHSASTAHYSPANIANIKPAIGGINFDRVIISLCSWLLGGVYLDGWAHNHGLVDKTFFTPWHAVLYSGYAATAIFLLLTIVLNHKRGYRGLHAIPKGYELSVLGVPLFLVAGVGDLIWHTLFGFETGVEPLLSPTHLVIAWSGLLITSGPLRAAWRRADTGLAPGWANLFPAMLSLLAILSISTFFTSFAHPFVEVGFVTKPNSNDDISWGVASILLQTGLLMGIILLVLRRWRLPLGTLTLILTLNIALMSVFKDQYLFIPVALVSGVLADLLLWWLKPSVTRPDALRLFAFGVPILFYLNYFGAILALTGGISWSVHLWLGTTVMAGLVGLALSYLLVPPRVSLEQAP